MYRVKDLLKSKDEFVYNGNDEWVKFGFLCWKYTSMEDDTINFLNENVKNAFILNGSYKIVFRYRGLAVSIELVNRKALEKRVSTFKMLKSMIDSNNQSCILSIPKDWAYIASNDTKKFLFLTKQELCYMDGFDYFSKHTERRIAKHIKPLARGLKFLHSKGVYIIDLKPDNMLLCGNSLKYADLDDVLIRSRMQEAMERGEDFKVIAAQFYSDIYFSDYFQLFKETAYYENNIDKLTYMFSYLDWYAWSMITVLYTLGMPKEEYDRSRFPNEWIKPIEILLEGFLEPYKRTAFEFIMNYAKREKKYVNMSFLKSEVDKMEAQWTDSMCLKF